MKLELYWKVSWPFGLFQTSLHKLKLFPRSTDKLSFSDEKRRLINVIQKDMASNKKGLDGDSDRNSRDSTEKTTTKISKAVLLEADLVTAKGNVVTKDGLVVALQEPEVGVPVNPFSDPEVKEYYTGVYEKAKYECRHVFDADLTWSKEEEKKLVRKLDWHGTHIEAAQIHIEIQQLIYFESLFVGMCYVL